MIITKLYLHNFSMFETLHPPNSFLVFQAKIEAYCRIKSYDRSVAPGFKGDVTRGRFAKTVLAQHSFSMLEQCCNHLKQCCNNVATLYFAKNRLCEWFRVTDRKSVV